MKISLQHIASNVNPMFNNVSCLDSHIVYSTHNQIIIHNPISLINSVSLNLNKSNIYPEKCNCVDTYKHNSISYVIGGYTSGHIAIFNNQNNNIQSYQSWGLKNLIKQDSSVLLVKIFRLEETTILITLNNNAQVFVYKIGQTIQPQMLQNIKFPLNKIPQSVDLTIVEKSILLVVGGADQLIHCYLSNLHQIKFQYSVSLKGHQNAITKLAFNKNLLASSSKDGYIRIWKISQKANVPEFQKSLFQINQNLFIYLESILISHEANVTNLAWAEFNGLNLISVSWDCTINVWEHDTNSWVVKNRLGQLYGNKNAFFGIVINPHHNYIIAINFTGASCVWQYNFQTESFVSKASFNGHFDLVKGIEWSRDGSFLVSTSKDQTTRVITKNHLTNTYHEVSRAQIHGYEINCLTLIKLKDNIADLIACGADQKIIRVLEPPANVVNYLNYFSESQLHLYFENPNDQNQFLVDPKKTEGKLEYIAYTETGTQVLGLMTKAQPIIKQKITNYYEKEDEQEVGQQEEADCNRNPNVLDYMKPPTEDYMVKHTLWPQINKLYGHPFEMIALTSSINGKYLASNCKSFTKEGAFTLIWDTATWKIIHSLSHHKSTVHDICFSKAGHLLTVSKDRTYGLYNSNFELLSGKQIHTRAITSGHFSYDSKYIITGSRDKTIKITNVSDGNVIISYDIKEPVHAVRFAQSDYKIAVGTENGEIIVLQFNNEQIIEKARVPNFIGHSSMINALRWTQRKGETLLASGSNDHTVRIFKIQ